MAHCRTTKRANNLERLGDVGAARHVDPLGAAGMILDKRLQVVKTIVDAPEAFSAVVLPPTLKEAESCLENLVSTRRVSHARNRALNFTHFCLFFDAGGNLEMSITLLLTVS